VQITTLRKIFVIGLLIALGFTQVGYYICMLHSQYELKEKIKHTVLKQLKNEDLTIISLTDNINKIYWEDDDDEKEFSFNGQMYDLVRTDTLNGRILLYCFNDKKEQQLIDLYNAVTKNNSATDKKVKNNSFISLTLFVWESIAPCTLFSFQKINQYNSFITHLPKGVTNSTSPPPRA
jgi:hypothetical protein